ncbi:hypothetical protein [Dendronalium sp. ChiSLP03b]|nr:hypothetical protein [Dendronalium sp. ChiSLP03b]
MLLELTESVKKVFKETASQLKGAARRRFLFPNWGHDEITMA